MSTAGARRKLARLRQYPEDVFWGGMKYGFLLFLISIILGPYLIVLATSFKTPMQIFGSGSGALIPSEPTLENWTTAFTQLQGPLLNSFIIALGTMVIALVITIPGAYAFGRKEFPGKLWGFYGIVTALLFPYVVLVAPLSSLWLDLDLYNSIPGLWLAYQIFVAPFAIWILRDFFEKLPANLEEAAQVYGCSQFTAFVRVILPLSAPAIAAVGFLSFLTAWNDFLFSSVLTSSQGPQPAVVILYLTISGGSGERVFWGLLMAQTLIIGTPPLVLYLFARRRITNAFAV
jgi:ABC-type glycerol-3-phosphate transport system permease component